MIKVYGITNCETVKKARAWLDGKRIAYEFVDFKKTPPDREQVARWCSALGADAVVNRRGTTWRKLDAACIHKRWRCRECPLLGQAVGADGQTPVDSVENAE